MPFDTQRLERIQQAIRDANWDALVCSIPTNVLMLTGYWPVVGTSIAMVTRDGQVGLLAPEDERWLAEKSWAHEVHTFKPSSLEEIKYVSHTVRAPLAALAKKLGLGRTIGYEHGPLHEPSSYASMYFYAGSLRELFAEAVPEAKLVSADAQLRLLRSVKTPYEIDRLQTACKIARTAYERGAKQVRSGLSEFQVAAHFRAPLSCHGIDGVTRADGFTFCMSGPNAAEAYAAYQISRSRELKTGDLALVHCNSYADGYWTDITRTFCLGEPDERQRKLFRAVLTATSEAIKVIKPGVKNSSVDRAAREVLRAHGFEKEFKHPSGHGVGFSAINHNSRPQIHPASPESLESGMVFNVEPGLYFEGWGGIRHCEMVAVTETGAELLTPFQEDVAELALR